MQINVHPTLAAQRAVLDLPPGERRATILQLLTPFEPALKPIMPPGADPITMFGLMRPDGPEAEYRAALARLEDAQAEATCRAALHKAVLAIAATGYTPPIPAIQFGLLLLETNPAMMKLTQGYTGFGGIPGYILVSLWPDDRNLPKLGACTVHEFNHNIRNTVEPFRMEISLAEYIVMEGLAESFAAELYGPEFIGPWITDAPELEQARQVIGGALDVRGFNAVRPYIFGDEVMAAFGAPPAGIPTYAGYVTGYHLVQAYLRKTGKTAAEATLVPSAEIVRVADYF